MEDYAGFAVFGEKITRLMEFDDKNKSEHQSISKFFGYFGRFLKPDPTRRDKQAETTLRSDVKRLSDTDRTPGSFRFGSDKCLVV